MGNAPFTFQNALDVTRHATYINKMPKKNITGFGRSDKLFAFSTQKEMERLIDVKIKIKIKTKRDHAKRLAFLRKSMARELNEGIR